MQLTVGTDSTWSLRAWICSRIAEIDLDIHIIDLSKADYKAEICAHSKAGLVPVLSDAETSVHDSLAIAEYLNELAGGTLLPENTRERALARSLCAELHSGFMQLRSNCPFTLLTVDALSTISDDIQIEIDRLESIFESAALPFMFSNASMVDAFYAILAFRLKHYGIELPGKAGEYQRCLLEWDLLNSAIDLAESWKQATQAGHLE